MTSGTSHVLFYNPGETYQRLDAEDPGDLCEWLAFENSALRDCMRSFDPTIEYRPDRPFPCLWGTVNRSTFYLHRQLLRYLGTSLVEPSVVEETAMVLLSQALESRFPDREQDSNEQHRAVVEEAKSLILKSYREPCSLDKLAQDLGVSVFHLCRIFKKRTGSTLHRFRLELRFRDALHALEETNDLTTLAFDLGFSSLSHFSRSFKQISGVSPSRYRARGGREEVLKVLRHRAQVNLGRPPY